MVDRAPPRHVTLTSHRAKSGPPIAWGAADPLRRGPIVGTLGNPDQRNVIGTHGGAYSLYRALAVAAGQLAPQHRPDFTDTMPADAIGPFAAWSDPARIVSLDPWGHLAPQLFADRVAAGWDIRPTIAVTRAHIAMPEIVEAMQDGRLAPDPPGPAAVLSADGAARVTKIAIEPVWWLPGVAARFGVGLKTLRRTLFEQTGGMFPELVTRPDLEVFLPPIGGATVYLFGDVSRLGRPE
ncbi:MAG: hypothetical protein JOZ42_16275, partial [Acetobacteraceae bacterium]|nr:hypothetical protein [Acetobacteraceae bacterium]